MARTAPAPNAAAPPGMAPFTAVKGGGGAGGGSGGGGAGSGGGGAGGGAGSGGEGGAGGGKGADGSAGGGCGAGGSGGCPNPEHGGGGSAKAGDPVDVLTGRVFTTPAVDMILAGPIPLVIRRSYSSFARDRDVGLGAGWCHSLAREITTLGRKLLLWDDSGRSTTLEPLELEEEVVVGGEALVRYDWGYVLKQPRVEHVFQRIGASFKVTQIRDAYRNKIELRYDEGGALSEIVDSAGRTLRVKRHPDGHIAAFEVRNAPERGQWVSFVRYSYDASDLVAATDANGHTTRFVYEKEHLLALVDSPSGRSTHYRYDPQHRCIETWVDHRSGGDPALDASVPDKLADGSRARGMLHVRMNRYDDFVELVNSREVRQLFSNENGRYV
ncbi:MAG TPA: DUF6531 domain-containing protein, partial [Polyangiaceae bacterium]|nr:DUF6531 domain-containing protein [Polyangiaceae bacterium]